MPRSRQFELTLAQRAELTALRDHAAQPHLREKAAAVLKVADGASTRAVAARGLLRPRRSETIARWVHRYLAGGPAAFAVRPGRGRKPAFPPAGSGDRP
jgi:hypothetical protein